MGRAYSKSSSLKRPLHNSILDLMVIEPARELRRLHSRENGAMNKKSNRFSPEVKERAVRLVQEHRDQHNSLWAAVESIAPKMGFSSDTLLERVNTAWRSNQWAKSSVVLIVDLRSMGCTA